MSLSFSIIAQLTSLFLRIVIDTLTGPRPSMALVSCCCSSAAPLCSLLPVAAASCCCSLSAASWCQLRCCILIQCHCCLFDAVLSLPSVASSVTSVMSDHYIHWCWLATAVHHQHSLLPAIVRLMQQKLHM